MKLASRGSSGVSEYLNSGHTSFRDAPLIAWFDGHTLPVPFGLGPSAFDHIKQATAFLYEAKSIDTAALPADAIQPQFAEAVLAARGLKAPVGEIKASAEQPFK